MHLDVIGSSPAWPNPGQAHAGYLVTASSGERVLLDCGPGVLAQLRDRDLLPIDGIVISHLHLDHWGDLVPWCWFSRRHRVDAGRPALWLPPTARGALRAFSEAFGSEGMFEATFQVHEYSSEQPFDVAGLAIEALPVAHYGVPSFGLRVSGDAVLGYSGDSAPCDAVRELARGAALLICEATLASASEDGEPRGHMTAGEARELAGDTRLLLAHRPIEHPPFEDAEVAAPGLRINL